MIWILKESSPARDQWKYGKWKYAFYFINIFQYFIYKYIIKYMYIYKTYWKYIYKLKHYMNMNNQLQIHSLIIIVHVFLLAATFFPSIWSLGTHCPKLVHPKREAYQKQIVIIVVFNLQKYFLKCLTIIHPYFVMYIQCISI